MGWPGVPDEKQAARTLKRAGENAIRPCTRFAALDALQRACPWQCASRFSSACNPPTVAKPLAPLRARLQSAIKYHNQYVSGRGFPPQHSSCEKITLCDNILAAATRTRTPSLTLKSLRQSVKRYYPGSRVGPAIATLVF